jgi:hypothetical protein
VIKVSKANRAKTDLRVNMDMVVFLDSVGFSGSGKLIWCCPDGGLPKATPMPRPTNQRTGGRPKSLICRQIRADERQLAHPAAPAKMSSFRHPPLAA